ncbi:hypothetical protein C8F01DRAFT_1084445 [Mycena amicta]|nr:hypothetical protein C8F01DRAFT_1084445 [Mycena amicta]
MQTPIKPNPACKFKAVLNFKFLPLARLANTETAITRDTQLVEGEQERDDTGNKNTWTTSSLNHAARVPLLHIHFHGSRVSHQIIAQLKHASHSAGTSSAPAFTPFFLRPNPRHVRFSDRANDSCGWTDGMIFSEQPTAIWGEDEIGGGLNEFALMLAISNVVLDFADGRATTTTRSHPWPVAGASRLAEDQTHAMKADIHAKLSATQSAQDMAGALPESSQAPQREGASLEAV